MICHMVLENPELLSLLYFHFLFLMFLMSSSTLFTTALTKLTWSNIKHRNWSNQLHTLNTEMRNTSLKQDNSRQNQRNIVIRDKLKNVIHSVNNNNLLLIYFTDKIQIKSMGINIQCKKRMYKNKTKKQ